MIYKRPHRLDLRALAVTAPLPLIVTDAGRQQTRRPSEHSEPAAPQVPTLLLPAPSAIGPATCLTCQIANIYGPPRCFGEDCPRRILLPSQRKATDSVRE